MIRILFLLLILLSSAAFAQTEEKPKATKLDEFEKATNGYVKMKMDYFYVELNNNPAAQGYIINYGTDREIATREKQIRVSIQWRKFDATRITFVRGGFREEVKSEFWLVPPGAENPQPDSTAQKFDEFGRIPNGDLKARLDNFYVELGNKPDSEGYVLIFGSTQTVPREEKRIRDYLKVRKFDPAKITFKNGGFDKNGKTEFWLVKAKPKSEVKTKIYIVPPGAKPPTQ